MCKAKGRLLNDYTRTKRYKRHSTRVAASTGIPVDLLVQTLTDVRNEERGTWAHPKIVWHLAMWCSGTVEKQVIDMLEDWRENPQLDIPQTKGEALMLAAQKTLELESHEKMSLCGARRSEEQQIELGAEG